PETLELLRGALPSAPPLAEPIAPAAPQRALWGTLLTALRSAAWKGARRSGQVVAAATTCAGACVRQVIDRFGVLRQRLAALRPARRPLLWALGVGGLVAAVTLFAPSWVAALLSGLGGVGFTLAVQLGLWVRRGLSALATSG